DDARQDRNDQHQVEQAAGRVVVPEDDVEPLGAPSRACRGRNDGIEGKRWLLAHAAGSLRNGEQHSAARAALRSDEAANRSWLRPGGAAAGSRWPRRFKRTVQPCPPESHCAKEGAAGMSIQPLRAARIAARAASSVSAMSCSLCAL